MIRHNLASWALLAMVLATGCASGMQGNAVKPINYDKRPLVAVGDVQNRTGNADYDALMDGLTGSLIYELHETRCFRLIERQRLKAMLEESKLGMLGLIDPKNSKEVGRMLGVNCILFVNLASVRHSSDVSSAIVAKTETETIEVTMDARLVAVETGEILAAAKASSLYKKTTGSAALGLLRSGDRANQMVVVQSSLEESLHDLAYKIAAQISERNK